VIVATLTVNKLTGVVNGAPNRLYVQSEWAGFFLLTRAFRRFACRRLMLSVHLRSQVESRSSTIESDWYVVDRDE
jgi:hypothetical protein